MVTKKTVTVADVAREAKVSKATAARVLGGYGVASTAARAAVQAAAERLGYRPNELARSMSTGRSGLIGVVVGDIENAFFSRAVRGISDVARAGGLNVVISNSGESFEVECEMVSVLLRQRVAGLIVAPTDARRCDHLKAAIAGGTPVVTFDREAVDLPADAVCGDDRDAAGQVLRRLHAGGHRRIAYVTASATGAPRLVSSDEIPISAVRARIEGVLKTSAALGLDGAAGLVFTNATDPDRTGEIVDAILAETPRVTAILASDSLVGARLFTALGARGVVLPRDMSLVSWFDADWTRLTAPPVSVVHQPTYELGRRAAELLIARLGGSEAPPQRLRLPTPLIERGSIGPAPA